MSTQYDAIVAGHICLDILPDLSGSTPEQFRRTFVPGHLLMSGPMTLCTGGTVSNTGLSLNKLGIATRLMGKVGDDIFGQVVRQIVASFGSDLADGMVVDQNASTSYTIVLNPPEIDRFFIHCPGANDSFVAADVRYDMIAQARLFHFGYPPLMRKMHENGGAELAEMFRRARSTGVTTSLDMALPDPASPAGRADWNSILRTALPQVDVFMPSIEEILYMLRKPDYHALAQAATGADILPLVTPELLCDLSDELLAMGSKIVGLKLGYRGIYLRTAGRQAIESMGRAAPADAGAWADREMWSPCFKVDVAGAAGAGDSTIAGFLSGMLRGLSPEDTLNAAVAVGACNVEAADTLSGVRPWDETLQRVATGWEKREMALDAKGWRYDPTAGLWIAS